MIDIKVIQDTFHVMLNKRTDFDITTRKNRPVSEREDIRKKWMRMASEMAVHVYGRYPKDLIESRRPREDDQRLQFRKDNYEPITKAIIDESIDTLYRIFNKNSYDITVSDDTDAYIKKYVFDGSDFMMFIQKRVVYAMIADPNALLVVLPSGKGLVDAVGVIDPVLEIIDSCEILSIDDDILIFKLKEKSLVSHYNKMVHEGDVYGVLTRYDYYKIYQVGKKTEDEWDIATIYNHNIGEIPYTVLGGNWNNDDKMYDSFFYPAIAWANEAIRQYSDWQGTMITVAYPHTAIRPVQCDNKGCNGGYINGDKTKICGRCKGSGFIDLSPYGKFVLPEVDPGDKTVDNRPPISFYSPNVDIIEYAGDAWKYMIEQGKRALHQVHSGYNESGDAKLIDREPEYAFIMKISNNIFNNIIYKGCYFIEKYRNIVNPATPVILAPQVFTLKTGTDLEHDHTLLKGSKASITILREVTRELIRARYSTNEDLYHTHLFLIHYDELYHLSEDEKLLRFTAGINTKKDLIKSSVAPNILDDLITEDKWNLDPENYFAIKKEVDKRIDLLYDEKVEEAMENDDTLGLQNNMSGADFMPYTAPSRMPTGNDLLSTASLLPKKPDTAKLSEDALNARAVASGTLDEDAANVDTSVRGINKAKLTRQVRKNTGKTMNDINNLDGMVAIL